MVKHISLLSLTPLLNRSPNYIKSVYRKLVGAVLWDTVDGMTQLPYGAAEIMAAHLPMESGGHCG